MTTNPRDLIKRLAEELDTWLMAHHYGGAPPEIQHAATLVAEARTALAEPESIKDRIAKADAAIEASMERIRAMNRA